MVLIGWALQAPTAIADTATGKGISQKCPLSVGFNRVTKQGSSRTGYTGSGSVKYDFNKQRSVEAIKNLALERARAELTKTLGMKISSRCESYAREDSQGTQESYECRDIFKTEAEFIKEDFRVDKVDPVRCEYTVIVGWKSKRVESILAHARAEQLYKESTEDRSVTERKSRVTEALQLSNNIDYSLVPKTGDGAFYKRRYAKRQQELAQLSKTGNHFIAVIKSGNPLPPVAEQMLADSVADLLPQTFTVQRPVCRENKGCLDLAGRNEASLISLMNYDLVWNKRSGFWYAEVTIVVTTQTSRGKRVDRLATPFQITATHRNKSKIPWSRILANAVASKANSLRQYLRSEPLILGGSNAANDSGITE